MKKKILLLTLALGVMLTVFVGCSKDKDEVINLGLIFPQSGPVSHFGIDSRDGIILATEEINAAGGLLGKRINLIIEDDEGSAPLTVAAFRKLTVQDGVSIVLGSSTSGATRAIAPLAQEQGVVLISPSATNIHVTDPGDFIFRACFIDPFQGFVGANFSFDHLNARRAAVLFDNGADYNRGLAEAFAEQFRARGGQVVAYEAYMTGDRDFNAQIIRMRSANPDVVFLPNYYEDVLMQAGQLRTLGLNASLVGGDGWSGVAEHAGASREAVGGFWLAAFSADTTDPQGVAFARTFESKFGRPSAQFSALGYDTMLIVADAIKRAGSADARAVRNAMAATDGTFVTGNIRFDEKRNPIKGATILEIQERGGQLVNVYRTTVNP